MKRKPEFIIMVGNIGAGKSTLVKEFVELGYRVISKDAIRYMLGGGKYIFDLELERAVDEITKNAVIDLTYRGYNVVIDETNMDSLERGDYLHYIHENKNQTYEKTAIVFPRLSKEESVKRRLQSNHGDTPKEVWEGVWEIKNKAYQVPTKEEGFDTIKELEISDVR